MEKNIAIIIIVVFCVLTSCVRENNKESTHVSCRARSVNYAHVTFMQRVMKVWDGIEYLEPAYLEISEVPGRDLMLILTTSNLPWREESYDREEGIPSLESQIITSYRARTRVNMLEIEYRLDAIKRLDITANQSLFGEAVGTPLNDKFTIVRYYESDFIANSNYRLVYGFSDRDKPTSIDEWLYLSPLAQPEMWLGFTEAPIKLPITVQFTVEMETDAGKVVSYTTEEIKLLE